MPTLPLHRTAVAFKFIVAELLPPLPYTTAIDIYIAVSILFLVVCTVVHCAFPMFHYKHWENSVLTMPNSFDDDDGTTRE